MGRRSDEWFGARWSRSVAASSSLPTRSRR